MKGIFCAIIVMIMKIFLCVKIVIILLLILHMEMMILISVRFVQKIGANAMNVELFVGLLTVVLVMNITKRKKTKVNFFTMLLMFRMNLFTQNYPMRIHFF